MHSSTASCRCDGGIVASPSAPRPAPASPLRASGCSLRTVQTPRPSKSSPRNAPLVAPTTPMLRRRRLPLLLAAAASAAAASSPTSTTVTSSSYLPPRSPTDDPSRLRVAVLTGWLGAGKTTTLTRWLEAAAAEKEESSALSSGEAEAGGGKSGEEKKRAPPRVRLIINDVGASSVDAAVLSKAEIVPPASLVALTAGCACCSLQRELVEAVASAAADACEFASSSSSSGSSLLLPDSWLFIECTGLALPAPVANAVAEGVRRAKEEKNTSSDGKDGEERDGENDDEEEEDPLGEEEASLEAVVAVVDASTFAAGLAGAFDVDDDDDDFEEEEEEIDEEEDEFDEQGKPRSSSFAGPRDFADDEGPFEELAGVASPEGSIADLLASQIEAADVVLLNKTDAVSLETLEEARALVEALNPGAKVFEAVKGDVPPSSLLGSAAVVSEGSMKRRRRGVAGWAAALAAAAAARNGKKEKEEESAHSHSHEGHSHGHHHHHHHEDSLHASAHGISSFVFHSPRPFHPRRLLEALEDDGGEGEDSKGNSNGPWKGVVRSKGFFWLATRPKVAGLWQAAGGSWVGDPSHLWERSEDEASNSSPSKSSSSSPQQELVFIGNRSMSEQRVREALKGALLTDEEMRGGEESWSGFEDELPPWELEG